MISLGWKQASTARSTRSELGARSFFVQELAARSKVGWPPGGAKMLPKCPNKRNPKLLMFERGGILGKIGYAYCWPLHQKWPSSELRPSWASCRHLFPVQNDHISSYYRFREAWRQGGSARGLRVSCATICKKCLELQRPCHRMQWPPSKINIKKMRKYNIL